MSKNREIVIPGEVLSEGKKFLPGEGTEKREDKIVALKYGIKDESNNLVRVIPLSGRYVPRKYNVVIGTVENLTMSGWLIDIDYPSSAFLPLMEVPKFVNRGELDSYMDVGDVVIAKITKVIGNKSIDLTIKGRGLGKVREGTVIKVNPYKVPRIIGKEGSMVNLIKEHTGCNIVVGQNGVVLIKGDTIDEEAKARKAIEMIVSKSLVDGLTDEIEEFLEGGKKKTSSKKDKKTKEDKE